MANFFLFILQMLLFFSLVITNADPQNIFVPLTSQYIVKYIYLTACDFIGVHVMFVRLDFT